MQLEINVHENIKVVDSLGGAIAIISEMIKEYIESDIVGPLNFTIRKLDSRAPPALSINVGESVKVKDKLV